MSGVLRELCAHTDAATLPHCIVRLLQQLIPADSAAYNSFNFQTGKIQVVHGHPKATNICRPSTIAMILSISKRTVDKQAENILRRLGVESRVTVALRAERFRQLL